MEDGYRLVVVKTERSIYDLFVLESLAAMQ